MGKKCLVSIVTPAHNAGKFVADAVNSVLKQTYKNWEMIVVDDASEDDTLEVLKQFSSKQIKVIELKKNSGAAVARNTGIEAAKGRFICFLDADDIWLPDKLAKQVDFMLDKDCAFSFAGYEFADASGKPNGKKVHVPATITYEQALRNTTIWTSTVMLDMGKLKKEDICMPNVRKGQDTVTWWKILKKIEKAYGLNEVVAFYRRSGNTLSSNKFKALKRTWNLYRKVEHLSILKSSRCFMVYCFNAVKRRV